MFCLVLIRTHFDLEQKSVNGEQSAGTTFIS